MTDPVSKAINKANPNVPRAIRVRQGQTEDPIPEGKHLNIEPRSHFALTSSNREDDKNLSAVKGLPEHLQNKVSVQDHVKEMRKAHKQDQSNYDRGHAGQRTQPPDQRVYPKTMISAANKLCDSRHGPEGRAEGKRSSAGAQSRAS